MLTDASGARAGGRGVARGMGVGTPDWMSGDIFGGGGM